MARRESRVPYTFADFVEIDAGLRQAMYEKGCRADLVPWLGKMKELLRADCPAGMKRKVQYEIAVVALRGLNNLSAEAELVAEFFSGLHAGLSPAELQDAAVLLTYCATAAQQGHFNVDPAKLADWASNLICLLDEAIDHAPGKNSLCDLLLSRAQACAIPVRGAKYEAKPEQMLDYWGRVLDVVPEAPLFPLEHFADIITKLTPFLVDDPRYPGITERVDELLEQRSSRFIAAGKCLDRARSLFDQLRKGATTCPARESQMVRRGDASEGTSSNDTRCRVLRASKIVLCSKILCGRSRTHIVPRD
jgi:hypothetical protein